MYRFHFQWRHKGGPSGWPPGGDTQLKLFLWLNLNVERWECWGDDRMTDKNGHHFTQAMTKTYWVFFQEKKGDTHQLPPRVTPTLVTPLSTLLHRLHFADVKLSTNPTYAIIELEYVRIFQKIEYICYTIVRSWTQFWQKWIKLCPGSHNLKKYLHVHAYCETKF